MQKLNLIIFFVISIISICCESKRVENKEKIKTRIEEKIIK